MCEFISWIETADNKIYFLTGDQIHKTKKGQDLKKYCQCDDDLRGHGAIRRYYRLANHDGKERECTDFSTPDNFPDEIVKAIKEGGMWGFGVYPKELLTAAAYAEYQKVKDAAEAEYQKVTAPAEAEYQKVTDAAYAEYQKVTAAAYAEYQKVKDAAEAEYQKVTAPAYAEYQKVKAPAYAEYQKVKDAAFWDRFVDSNNRNPRWK